MVDLMGVFMLAFRVLVLHCPQKRDQKPMKPTPTQHRAFGEKESFHDVEEEFPGTGCFQSKKMLRHRRFFRKYSGDS